MRTITVKTGTNLPNNEETGSFDFVLDKNSPAWLGATTVAQVLRRLPEDFRGGPSEDTRAQSKEAASNAGQGAGVNLRGLGSRATLVLLNGERLAPSGTQGAFTDVLQLPLSVVDHMEVVMDGASAIYGADAVGGVVNVITRKEVVGSEAFADVGGSADGSQHQMRLGFLRGLSWDSGNAVLAVEDYRRQALPAAKRGLARSDLRPWGADLGTPYSDPGTLVTSAGSYAVPSGIRNGPLDLTQLPLGSQDLSDVYRDADLMPRQVRDSLYGFAHQNLADGIEGSLTALWAQRHLTQYEGGQPVSLLIPKDPQILTGEPNGPDPVRLQYNLLDTLGSQLNQTTIRTADVAAELRFDMPRGWSTWASLATSREQEFQLIHNAGDASVLQNAVDGLNGEAYFNPLNGSTIPASVVRDLRTQLGYESRSQLWQLTVKSAGPLGHLPGGDPQGAFGGEFRNQTLSTASWMGLRSNALGSVLGRRLRALFGEIEVPVFGDGNARTALEALTFSLAARYEKYDDFASTLTPRFWVVYSPLERLRVKSSYARATRAPNLGDLQEGANISFEASVSDPTSSSGTSKVLVWQGGNRALKAEYATSYTIGLQWLPPDRFGPYVDLSYFDINYHNQIQSTAVDPETGVVANVLMSPSFQDIVNRTPSSDQRAQVCRSRFAGSAAACTDDPIAAIVDSRARNVATLTTRGVDLSIHGTARLGAGQISYGLTGVYLLEFSERDTPYARQESLLNTPHYPINLQLLTNIGWSWHGFGVRLNGNYSNGYHDPTDIQHPNIRSWTTFDAGIQYDFGWANSHAQDRDLTVGLNVENLFNRGPPQIANTLEHIGYDRENADLGGRVGRLSVAFSW